jgi:hypothetical protein
MRVMVFGKAVSAGGDAAPMTEEAFAAMDRYTEELVKAGVFVAAAGLQNGATAKRVVVDGGAVSVSDGPFAETNALVAGFSIWKVKDMAEAVAWAKRNPMLAWSEMEIRPFYEAEDLAEFIPPEQLAASREGDRGTLGVA